MMFGGLANNPGNADGALIVSIAPDGTLTPEYVPSEQGVHSMLLDNDGTLIVPGTDPHPDGWQFGNIYKRTGVGAWSKNRNMPNVIHSLGACIHNGNLYVATAAHAGDNQTWQGRVFRSPDQGQTWDSIYVCYYRVYDVASFDGKLYVLAWDWPTQRLFVSQDDGDTWQIVAGVEPQIKPRLTHWDGRLIGVTAAGGLFALAAGGGITTHTGPETIPGQWNILAGHTTGFYVLIGGHLWHTEDLESWTYHCDLGNQCVSLTTWDDVGLIVSERGPNARLLKVAFA